MYSDLKGKVAIITGGNKGLGRAICLALGREGAKVAVAARTIRRSQEVVEQIKAAGGHAIAVPLDVMDPASAATMVEQVVNQWGSVDLLVNNAGIQGKMDWAWNFTTEDWDHIMNVNLRGPFLCCKAVLPGMMARRAGKIVNVAAGVMEERVDYGCAAYYAAKAGLIIFTRNLAAELKRCRVFVNAIDPGGLKTAMSDEIMAVERATNEFAGTQTNKDPARRLRDPEEIVPMVLFLLSTASDMMTGRLLQATSQDEVQYLQL